MSGFIYKKFRSRSFRFLLYPENISHLYTMDKLCNSDETRNNVIWIRHRYQLEDGTEDIHGVSGLGKSHWHVYLKFDNARSSDEILKFAEVEPRFLQQITGRFENALVYLLHRNTPEKEQYSLDDLGGAAWLLDDARKAVLRFEENNIPMSQAVCALIDWIDSNFSLFVSAGDLARFAADNGLFKACQHPLTRIALQEHNEKVSRALRRKQELQDSELALLNRRLSANGFYDYGIK